MNKLKKILLYFFTFIFICSSSPFVLANEEDTPLTHNELQETLIVSSNDLIDEPSINSRTAIVLDRTSNTILYGKNENQKRKMASTTKIMTAIIILENHNLKDVVTVSKKAASTGGSRLGLKPGDKISVFDLLHGLMLCSGNDAAVALAEYSSGSVESFANKMNNKAKNLGFTNTNYVTPHGLDHDNHYTTAYELALLTNYALENKTFRNLVSTKTYTVTINGNSKSIRNTNELLGNLNGVYGVKTGFTNGANRCLVTSTKRDSLDIICVVLGADTKKFRTQDSAKLIEYTYNNFEITNIQEKIEKEFYAWKETYYNNFHIIKGTTNKIDVELEEIPFSTIPLKKEKNNSLSVKINANYTLEAPIKEKEVIGYLQVKSGTGLLLNLEIYNTNEIKKNSVLDTVFDLYKNYIIYLEECLTVSPFYI